MMRISRSFLTAAAIWLLLNTVSLFSLSVNSFDLPVKSSGNLFFYLDVCQFEGQEGRSNVEFIYSVDLFQFQQAGTPRDSVRLKIHLELLNTKSQVLLNIDESRSVPLSEKDGSKEAGSAFIDLMRFGIEPDTIQLHFTISDEQSGKKGFVNAAFMAKKFQDKLSLSDLLFISYIQKSSRESNFVRHGVMMVPNPGRFYRVSEEIPNLLVYYEVNNLHYNPDEPSLYALNISVEDLGGKEIYTKDEPTLPVSGENTSRAEKIELKPFLSGAYRLNIRVTDLKTAATTTLSKYFRLYSDSLASDLLLPMTKKDAEKYYDQIKYLATEKEKKLYKKLDQKGKQEFLLRFWKSRDPVPETPENEFMEEYFTRIAYCEQNFKDGINSDMGRIYLVYGAPMDIRRAFSTNRYTKPVEVWIYAIEGQTEFIFVDRIGDGAYMLVHSTHPDEFSNPDWERDVR
jgi:GWxTD domain-containing protein